MNTVTHNGWANYETWLVRLWIDNDQGAFETTLEVAREALRLADTGPHAHQQQHASADVAAYLQDWFDMQAGEALPNAGPLTDLLDAALSAVDWREIAGSYISDAINQETTHARA